MDVAIVIAIIMAASVLVFVIMMGAAAFADFFDFAF